MPIFGFLWYKRRDAAPEVAYRMKPAVALQEETWTPAEARGAGTGIWAAPENFILCLSLGLMTLIPLAEAVMRVTLPFGISGASSLVQHMVLVVGMVGGAVAARQDRLLSLAILDQLPGKGWKRPALLFAGAMGAAMAALLCATAVDFVKLEREAGKILAYDVPVWVAQLVMPAGFALIAWRIVVHSAKAWRWRLVAAALAACIVWAGVKPPADPELLAPVALIALLVATAMGTPIFAALGGAALILFWGAGEVVAGIPIEHYRLVTNPTLPTLPLFTLAGYFLAEGGASRRLVRVFHALVGQFRGGPALIATLVCAFFTSFTGASGVTILALGGLLYPVLVEARYSERSSLGLLTGAGSLGLLFPPCLPLILYGVIAGVAIEKMFLGGILPGFLLVALTAWWGIRQGPPVAEKRRFDAREAARAVWAAKWELALPAVVLVSLFGGFATPVESAALTAFYAFLTQTLMHRDLSLGKDIGRVITEAGLLVGGVLLILGVALGFTNYLIDAQIPSRMVEYVQSSITSPWVFLLVLNVFLLLVGALMDIFSAIVVVVPLIVPIGEAFGIDPVHLGIIFLANMELGYLTPPVGINLFLSSYRFSKPVHEVYRSILPMLVVLGIGVLLITYIPVLTTFLPGLTASP
ncbi:MAG: TRAP transporter large permease subunit [Acidimicrobiia bacterium]|nr:TRAP transporter large permease subunit [Acidimicrobiia bacterium]